MSTRTVNLTLFVLTTAQWLSGFGGFLAGGPGARWVLWLHAAGAFAIVVLLPWKGRIIVRSLRGRGLGAWATQSLLLLALFALALVSGLLWSSFGLPNVLGSSGLTAHVILSLAMVPFFAAHAWAPAPHPRPRDYLDRRRFFRRAVVVAGGVALWRGAEQASAAAGLSGSERRFTGSRLVEGSGANFPETSWLFDDPRRIDRAQWRLQIDGAVDAERVLALGDLPATASTRATLDCTGGWYAERLWRGVALADLLPDSTLAGGARSVVVHGVTGYSRRFSVAAARRMLLAVSIDSAALDHGHGAPLRLVAPGHRGYDWVKWVTRLEVSRAPAWWNWPLPVR